ncbi:uncharacterized protein BX663DRAFT_245286 [Cokeromyces recurvatus]|uniref:uncharacterized protein n=1 Tax=Cokeromyces recurvatus TaxID=90255 RepID=UPI00221F837F|nr:uncharacterized protein BX663DRAFT_245286 [Cokeromyces recurvatus]KAI7905911.1 hypothetical protein BX663DRAFT_245286 [Cokeromyces recurvatus]
MNRPELQDAFSKTLDTKPRHSYVNHIKQQFQEEEVGNKRVNGSTVNRLSRVFEATHLDKPPLPSKPPILNSLSTEQKPQSIQRPQLLIHTAEIDETQLTFKDLRAKFQQENSIPTKSPQQINYRPPIPLKPSKTGPPLLPEKIILAAKTGPPALPIKPRTNNQKYTEPSHHPLPPLRQYQSSTQQLEPNDALHRASNLASTSASILSIPTMLSRTETGNSSILSTTSTSSQASSFTNSKRGWHISNWFTNQQHQQQRQQNEHLKNSIRRPDSDNSNDEENEPAKTVSPQYTADIKPNIIEKRRKVVEELIETEKSYQKDMTLLKDIYYDGACKAGVFSKSDMRHLFSNLINIVEFEKTFVTLLETSCEQDSIGSSFSEMVKYAYY